MPIEEIGLWDEGCQAATGTFDRASEGALLDHLAGLIFRTQLLAG